MAVELGDRDDEACVNNLASEHRPVDVEIVRMRGKAVRQSKQSVNQPCSEPIAHIAADLGMHPETLRKKCASTRLIRSA
ncbi:MAG: hypothetical protein WKF94_09285 [Solirubrobacteraceae bacterium]